MSLGAQKDAPWLKQYQKNKAMFVLSLGIRYFPRHVMTHCKLDERLQSDYSVCCVLRACACMPERALDVTGLEAMALSSDRVPGQHV